VEITTPVWDGSASSADQGDVITSSTPTCSRVTTNLNSVLVCSFLSGDNKFTMTNGFNSGAASNDSIQFKIGNMRNPPSTEPQTGYTIKTIDSSGNVIDECSMVSLKATEPNIIKNVQYYMTPEGIVQ